MDWQPEASRKMLATREFTFLNRTVASNGAIPWNDRRHAKLWLYHLNYFDFLNVGFALPDEDPMLQAALEITLDWCRHNTRRKRSRVGALRAIGSHRQLAEVSGPARTLAGVAWKSERKDQHPAREPGRPSGNARTPARKRSAGKSPSEEHQGPAVRRSIAGNPPQCPMVGKRRSAAGAGTE